LRDAESFNLVNSSWLHVCGVEALVSLPCTIPAALIASHCVPFEMHAPATHHARISPGIDDITAIVGSCSASTHRTIGSRIPEGRHTFTFHLRATGFATLLISSVPTYALSQYHIAQVHIPSMTGPRTSQAHRALMRP